MQVNQGNKTNPNTAGILGNTGVDPLRKKSGCQDEDSINEVLYAAQVKYVLRLICSKHRHFDTPPPILEYKQNLCPR